MKTKKQLEEAIQTAKRLNLNSTYIVAEATLTQTNEIIKLIEDFMKNKGFLDMSNNTRMWDLNTQQELLAKIRGENG